MSCAHSRDRHRAGSFRRSPTSECQQLHHHYEHPQDRTKDTLFTRHRSTVEPTMVANDRKATLRPIHTREVNQEVNVVLDNRPPLINNSENVLTRNEGTILGQLKSGHCRLLGSYKSRIDKDDNLNVCTDCGSTPHAVKHIFNCPAHPTTVTLLDLWS